MKERKDRARDTYEVDVEAVDELLKREYIGQETNRTWGPQSDPLSTDEFDSCPALPTFRSESASRGPWLLQEEDRRRTWRRRDATSSSSRQ